MIMLDITNPEVKKRLFEGNFGLEKESIRVLEDGSFSHAPHPFPDDPNITRDFCENQIEINTGVHDSVQGAVDELEYHNRRIYAAQRQMPQREYLWLFSNPPYIRNEEDIPIASFTGRLTSKTAYRKYLSDKYGRYKMTFSGIHVNFSFSDALLLADYEGKGAPGTFRDYKDRLYLDLAERLAAYSWLLVPLTAASPVMDSSFVERNVRDADVFMGLASVRCSELGYWNGFAPIFDYTDIDRYAQSIRTYVERGFLHAPSELYYPVRLKPPGENTLRRLQDYGVNHVELRMFDLNPLEETGINAKDVSFAHLMMIWLASTPKDPFTDKDQVQAVQNFKNAARYDLKTVKILVPNGDHFLATEAAEAIFDLMEDFYADTEQEEIRDILNFEREKFTDAEKRYSRQVRKLYGSGFAKKALTLSKERQGP